MQLCLRIGRVSGASSRRLSKKEELLVSLKDMGLFVEGFHFEKKHSSGCWISDSFSVKFQMRLSKWMPTGVESSYSFSIDVRVI